MELVYHISAWDLKFTWDQTVLEKRNNNTIYFQIMLNSITEEVDLLICHQVPKTSYT